MPSDQETASRPIRLNVKSVEQVVIEPDDKDRFVMTVKEAARACQVAEGKKGFGKAFRRFLLHLKQWCEERADRIEAAYGSVSDCFNLTVCTRSDRFDYELDEQIAALEIELVKKYDWCIIDVAQMPRGTWDAARQSGNSILVYGGISDGN